MSLILKDLDKYMFSSKHMMSYNKIHNAMPNSVPNIVPNIVPNAIVNIKPSIVQKQPVVVPLVQPLVQPIVQPIPIPTPVADTAFTPFQKDKLFWCFYVLLNGFTEYEMHRTGHYAIEKAFKISSVEKLRTMKTEIKDLKLKISEVEDELVNKEQISIKGLQVLCLIYKVSITYIYGKQYCEFFYNDASVTGAGTGTDVDKIGIILRNEKKEHSLLYEDSILATLKDTHWYIENVQKPLKAPSAYTLKDLQDICEKLEVSLKYKQKNAQDQVVEKNKLKKELYEDILKKI